MKFYQLCNETLKSPNSQLKTCAGRLSQNTSCFYKIYEVSTQLLSLNLNKNCKNNHMMSYFRASITEIKVIENLNKLFDCCMN